ncbi:MAG: 2-phospho-L-lactate guanylyltransferase [Halobacteriaceae archaeon]
MRAVVPFDAADPKTRLADVFSPAERRSFADAMLADVLDAVQSAGADPTVLATAPIAADAPVEVNRRPLTDAVNDVLEADDGPVAVVMADLALATGETCRRLFDAPGDVVLAAGRGGGTNALVARHPDFRVDYHGISYRDHLRAARRVGASVFEFDSHRLATDVDERGDLAELLIHGEGAATEWLESRGVSLAVEEGRVGVER